MRAPRTLMVSMDAPCSKGQGTTYLPEEVRCQRGDDPTDLLIPTNKSSF